ncbi:MAG: hypothetical protein GXP02_09110 [Alphaproteobacteria bacterium]|nr:hypothetical protein [Alphaproteobacteria bacterium]
MVKTVDNSVLDAALNDIKTKCTLMTACAGQPLSFTAANSGGANYLAGVAMAATDFTVGNGVTSGRKVAVASKSGITVTTTGTGDHIALLDTVGGVLLYVTTAIALGLTSGSTLTLGAWNIEIADPV